MGEHHVRRLIDGKLTKKELASAKDPADTARLVESVSDLTFGEYIRLFNMPNLWKKMNVQIDRKVFTAHLDAIRVIRNDIMHFDPDGLTDEQNRELRDFLGLVHKMDDVGLLES